VKNTLQSVEDHYVTLSKSSNLLFLDVFYLIKSYE